MKFLNDLTIQQIVARGAAYLVLAALLGGAIALCAGRPHSARRPSDHVSLPGLGLAVLFQLGWLRPLTPAPNQRAAALAASCALMGPVLLIALGDALRPVLAPWALGPWSRFGLTFLGEFQLLAAGLLALALVPLPPLPGGYILAALAPSLHARLARWQDGIAALLALAIVTAWVPPISARMLGMISRLGG